ncbi:hypothetical protein F5Y09DRAFT_140708 [Xylaria sp. FL1042]|nr:hypothetical protein F5Y09DRAFT_140708 [Xylaria sp. FL1042]
MTSMEGLVERTPREDAGINEVRSWVLEIFNRRCHPDPETALNGFFWKGRDLHSQRRYLALRLRFRGEPYGYMIAHDIHDAVKESRKRAHKREKAARKQKKTGNKPDRKSSSKSVPNAEASSPSSPHLQPDGSAPRNDQSTKVKTEQAANINVNHNLYVNPLIGENNSRDTKSKSTKVKDKFASIFNANPETASSRTTPAVAPLSVVEDPFRDPIPEPKKTKTKTTKLKRKRKWKKATASLESLGSTRDPFRDPEPMRLIDADDFRLESPEDTDYAGASRYGRGLSVHKLGRARDQGKVKRDKDKDKDKKKKQRK